jgi:hypothetical protein
MISLSIWWRDNMIVNEYAIKKYNQHSAYANLIDWKKRIRFFDIQDIDKDYQLILNELEKYWNLKFDFVASCLKKWDILLRVFNADFTGRFGIIPWVNIEELKSKLVNDHFIRMPKSKKSGPLCLYQDFSEPNSAFRFRLFLPLRELWDKIRITLRKYWQKS